MLVSAGSCIKLWDVNKNSLLQGLPSHSGYVKSFTLNKDGQVLASLDGHNSEVSIHTFNGASSVCSGAFKIMDKTSCIQFGNRTNRYMAVGGSKKSVIIWDVKDNSTKKSFHLSENPSKISFNSVDTHFAVGTATGKALFVANTTNVVSRPMQLFSNSSGVMDIQYSSNHRSLLGACSDNGSVVFVDSNVNKIMKTFSESHTAPVSAVIFSPFNNLLLISVGCDKKFVCYNANSKSVLLSCETPSALTSATFLDQSHVIAFGTYAGDVLFYDIRSLSSPTSSLKAYQGPVHHLEYHANHSTFENGSKNTTKKISENFRNNRHVEFAPSVKATPNATKDCSSSSQVLSPFDNGLNTESIIRHTMNVSPKPSQMEASFDDYGILSPLQKENRSPAFRKSSLTPQRESNRFSLIDGILSPLRNNCSIISNCSTTSLGGNVSTSHQSPITPVTNVEAHVKDHEVPSKIENTIDPYLAKEEESKNCSSNVSDKEKHDIPLLKEKHDIPLQKDKNYIPLLKEKHDIPLQKHKHDIPLLKEKHDIPLPREKHDIPSLKEKHDIPLQKDKHDISLLKDKHDIPSLKEKHDIPLLKEKHDISLLKEKHDIPLLRDESQNFYSEIMQDEIPRHNSESSVSDSLISENIQTHLHATSCSHLPQSRNEVVNVPNKMGLTPAPSTNIGEVFTPASNSNTQELITIEDLGLYDIPAYKIAFPDSDEEERADLTHQPETSEASTCLNGDLNPLNLQLLKNHIDFQLFRHDHEASQRILKMYGNLQRQIWDLKNEVLHAIKDNSLIDDLLAEICRLKEENERLKLIY